MPSTTVNAFNSLARPELAPSGAVPNHWHFTIKHVPLQPPGDLLFMLNPASRYVHIEGPAQILSLPTAAAKADVVVPLLLKGFLAGMGAPADMPKNAPWSWATNDEELARAVEAKLREMGVREELCTVTTGITEEDEIAAEEWPRFVGHLMRVVGPQTPRRAR